MFLACLKEPLKLEQAGPLCLIMSYAHAEVKDPAQNSNTEQTHRTNLTHILTSGKYRVPNSPNWCVTCKLDTKSPSQLLDLNACCCK